MNQKKLQLPSFLLLLLWSVLFTQAVYGQQAKRLIADGNQLYQKGKYKDASIRYAQALKKDTANTIGHFNLGNALYKQKQLDAARNNFNAAAKKATSASDKSRADYNIGNTYMDEKKWEDAIEAYKNALRKNPQDADAKYNLAYAKAMLKKEGGGGKNDKNKDKKEDQKDKDKQDQQNKDEQKDQQKKDEQNKDEQGKGDNKDENKDNQKPEPQPSKLSQQQADQLLDALQQEEKKLQEKNKKVKGVPVKMEKDW